MYGSRDAKYGLPSSSIMSSGKWLHAFFGLSMLPPDMVPDAFLTLIQYQDSEWPAAFTVFADYVTDTYVSDTARYPPEIWARDPTSSDPRTTNAAESFHRHFNDSFRGAHPNIHHLTETLLDIQAGTHVKFNSIRRGIPARRDPQVTDRYFRACAAYGELLRGERSMYRYLKFMGFLFKKK
ncbi:hypothetical protein KUF71_020082 [Frankliniella fusca]|uniref:MULE transposase domain-containing protein n=1 Tax=Frankliniella fusca TaxID=407009 RepID=A0AAE1GWT8_9NEOP|nr:hypothetical protein KUF71_020082 [Frankliniella fusca]